MKLISFRDEWLLNGRRAIGESKHVKICVLEEHEVEDEMKIRRLAM